MEQDSEKLAAQIEAYLQGRLSEDDEAAFEEAYLSNPSVLDELELTDKLRRGIGDVLDVSNSRPSGKARFWTTPQYALAASTLLGLFVIASAGLWTQNRSLQMRFAEPELNSTRVLQLVSVRGADDMRIGAAAQGEWTVLLADPGPVADSRFNAVLSRSEGTAAEVVWTGADLTASFDGMVPVGLPGSILSSGRYELVLFDARAQTPDTPISRYGFRIEASQ